MKPNIATLLATVAVISLPEFVCAQHPPSIGYMFPPGGQAGQTVDVILGGYDWTPDMQLFVHDRRIQLEIISPPGPIIVPEPPYWFGKKSRRAPEPLPRETIARLTIASDVPPGIVTWQAANANGATSVGKFVVNHVANVVEVDSPITGLSESGLAVQQIASLPVCISGQIKHIQEVDRYQFTTTKSGPITCQIVARAIDSKLNAVVEIRDHVGKLVAEAADTAGNDIALTFATSANETYTASVYDLDFRGDRSFVYQLTLTPGPRVVTAIPAIGRSGETRPVEFVGYGIASGQAKLESVMLDVTFPNAVDGPSFLYQLSTPHGNCPPFLLHVSDEAQLDERVSILTLPCGITGVLDQQFGEDVYQISGKKGDVWAIHASSSGTGSQVDALLTVFDPEGNRLVRNDDREGSTDAETEFTVPTDGDYQIRVTNVASLIASRAATYHLSVKTAEPDFSLRVPELLNAPISGKTTLPIKVLRRGGFTDAIDISLSGLPVGVTFPDKLQVPAKQNALNVELTVADDAAASASVVNVAGTVIVNERAIQQQAEPILVATTIKPPFSIDAEGLDDVTKWPRGSTFPAPVLIVRDAGFDADIVLEMTSRQGRHRQGISAPDLVVPPDVNRMLYPVYLPEWLETTRTSRMVVNGVARIADQQGNVRYSVSRQKTRMGFLPTGALLKISADKTEFQAKPGQKISVAISIDRSPMLTEPITLELCCNATSATVFTAKPVTLAPDVSHAEFSITVSPSAVVCCEQALTIRATLMKDGEWPVVSETTILMELED